MFNYKLLSVARDLRGITQKTLCENIVNLSQGNLSRIEKGALNITDDVLKDICDFLNVPVSFFSKEEVKTPISSFYYRKRMSMSKRSIKHLESLLDIVRIGVNELLKSIEIDGVDLPQIEVVGGRKASEIARIIRGFFKVGKGPLENIVSLLESKGIIVLFIDSTSEKFDGITLLTDSNQPIIFINKEMPNDRKRFTLAHELGHLIMHIPFPFNIDSERDVEKEANEFASELLMPELEVRDDLIGLTYSKLPMLKEYWKVSKAALIYRAKALNIITVNKATNLMIELSRSGERKIEKEKISIDNSRLLRNIVDLFKRDLEYTQEEICDVMGVSLDDFDLFMQRENEVRLRVVR